MRFARLRPFAALFFAPILLGLAPPGGQVKIGQPAPPFTAKTFAKEEISLDSMRGQVVLLNFWATWCVPCRKELPELDLYFRRHRDKGLRVFAVATETSLPAYRLQPLAKVVSFPLVLRLKGSSSYYPIKNAVPTTYIIDRKGVVRYAKSGALDQKSLDAILKPLIDETL